MSSSLSFDGLRVSSNLQSLQLRGEIGRELCIAQLEWKMPLLSINCIYLLWLGDVHLETCGIRYHWPLSSNHHHHLDAVYAFSSEISGFVHTTVFSLAVKKQRPFRISGKEKGLITFGSSDLYSNTTEEHKSPFLVPPCRKSSVGRGELIGSVLTASTSSCSR